LPRYINEETNMQAASPAFEITRLFTLLDSGLQFIYALGGFIVLMSSISVLVSLVNALKERRYELAIMRSMGGTRVQLFLLILIEGLFITILGSFLGFLISHLSMEVIGNITHQPDIKGTIWLSQEFYILAGSFLVGLMASLIPALGVYKTNISQILSKG
jgi:putative ABC transport system permease protein